MSLSTKEFPKLSSSEESQLIHELTHYALSQGLLIYPPLPFKQYQPVLAPVTLYPTPFPKEQFAKAVEISTKYNELYANIVIEKKWLTSIISELSRFDKDFTGKLYGTYLTALKNGIVQPVSLALIRSDYMLDTKTGSIKQIEFNTVSVSFGGLSSKVGDLHKYLNDSGHYTTDGSSYYDSVTELPVSESASLLAKGLYHGVSYYQSHHTHKNQKTIVLFVIQPNERNAFDQRCVEFALFKNYGVRSKRVELPDVSKSVKVDEATKKLYYQGEEVSVVYYRSAYGPSEFEVQEAWDARLLLETTLAIKCPSLLTQLSGSKKIQQLLTEDTIIDKFLKETDSSATNQLKSTFVKIYPMESKQAIELAFEHPENFVLKPQREGGGNNIYKEDIPTFLNSIPKSEWAGYILMELINPPVFDNPILKADDVVKEGLVSELGVFGSYLFNESNGEILNNDYSGHLLRSKTQSSNEGGVAAGFGCVDSLYLY